MIQLLGKSGEKKTNFNYKKVRYTFQSHKRNIAL